MSSYLVYVLCLLVRQSMIGVLDAERERGREGWLDGGLNEQILHPLSNSNGNVRNGYLAAGCATYRAPTFTVSSPHTCAQHRQQRRLQLGAHHRAHQRSEGHIIIAHSWLNQST